MTAKKSNPKSLHRVPPIPSIQTKKKKNNNTTDEKTQESKHPKTDILTTKTPQNEDVDAETTQADRTLQLTTQAVIINKRTTTPVTLEIRPTHGSSNLSIAIAHRNIFIAMKKKDQTLKVITENTTIDTMMQFPTG